MKQFASAKGKHLTNLASILGVKRRWLGLEPDFMLRNRCIIVFSGRYSK